MIAIQAADEQGILVGTSFNVTVDFTTGVDDTEINIPESFELAQNYPNPFNPTTTIAYSVPLSVAGENVKLEIYNILGQKIRTLVDEKHNAGFYSIQWEAKNEFDEQVSSGLYLYRMTVGSFIEVKKMLLLR